MEREYVRGNKEHWKEVYKYIYGIEPSEGGAPSICSDDKGVFVKNKVGGYNFYSDRYTYDAITTNPHWHEVRPWENNYEPKPFDKVLGWNDDKDVVWPDIFLYKGTFDKYYCAKGCYMHVKPYNEEEYLKSLERSTDDE